MTVHGAQRQFTLGALLDCIGRAAKVGFGWILYSIVTLWTAGAVYVDGPFGMASGNAWLAAGWTIIAVAVLVIIRTPWKRNLLWLTCVLAVLVPWLNKSPSNDREWLTEWIAVPLALNSPCRFACTNARVAKT